MYKKSKYQLVSKLYSTITRHFRHAQQIIYFRTTLNASSPFTSDGTDFDDVSDFESSDDFAVSADSVSLGFFESVLLLDAEPQAASPTAIDIARRTVIIFFFINEFLHTTNI